LSDVIGKTVKLKRAGREYVGLSPFNKEKSPSFYVNDEKGFFHDFSSGKHGDLIAFFQETERLSFIEAIERMAGEAGVALPDPDPQAARQEEKRQGLADWLALAAKWFEGELRRPAARRRPTIWTRRGLPADQWARFGVGFAPANRTGLKDYLIAKGAKPAELVEAGLLIAPEEGGAPPTTASATASSFRSPTPAAGSSRSAAGPWTPTPGPNTSTAPTARCSTRAAPSTACSRPARCCMRPGVDGAPLVVVEGYMDVIACHRAGVAAVAPMGTALTEGQMELLWRLHGEPTLCFDGDNAGRRAAGRAIDRALPLLKPGRSFRFALVSGGKDPDDVLREQGPAALKAQLSQTTPFVEQLWVRERDAEPLDTPERKTGLKIRLRKLAAGIADGDLAQAYRDDLLKRFDDEVSPAPASRAGATLANARWDRQRSGGGGWKRGKEPPGRASEDAKASARALNASPRPLSAALALAALNDPGCAGRQHRASGCAWLP
jgi:DNA primase